LDKRDKIYLNNMQFYGYHGLFNEEKKLGQQFNADVILFTDLSKAGKSGKMEDSIHYGEAFEAVQEIVEGEAVDLLETLAENTASRLLSEFSLVDEVMVRIIKPNPPIAGHYESVSVEIFRTKDQRKRGFV